MSLLDGYFIDQFASWRDFKAELYERITDIQTRAMAGVAPPLINPKRIIFRGQSCSSWSLETSFDRWFRDKHKAGTVDIDREYQRCLEEFCEDCRFLGVDGRTPEKLEPNRYLEEIGQHHGFPTRLLDWSISPYVAAFFAFVDERKCSSGSISIWALDCDEMSRCLRPQEVDIIRNTFANNERMRMQLGLFTRNSTNMVDLESIFLISNNRFHSKPRFPVLYRFDIPVTEAALAISDLERMSIDFIKLFPGIEGLCKQHEYIISKKSI